MAIESFKDDIGLKISLPQKNVNTAADQELIFNSAWPNLATYKLVHVVTNAPPDVATVLFEHNLGFVPAVFFYQKYFASGALVNTRSSLIVDEKAVYIYPAAFGATTFVPVDDYLVISIIDIEQNVEYPTFKTATTRDLLLNTDYGLKVAKEGKSITSTSPRDYVFHSGARSPMVHSITWKDTTSLLFNQVAFQATHNLPYTPLFALFGAYDYFQAPPGVTTQGNCYVPLNGFAGITSVDNAINVQGNGSSGKISCVIFKDPFEQTDIQEIQL